MSAINSASNTLQSNSSATFLKRALYANAIFSGISGLDFVIFSNRITNFLGWPVSWLIPAIGVGLMLFALFIVMVVRTVARSSKPNKSLVQIIIASDVAWIVLSCAIIFLPTTNLLALTTGGKWAVAILADIVLVFAILQFLGLRRIQ